MDSDLGNQLVAARMVGTQGSIQTAILKKTTEAERDVLSLLTQPVLAPPPPGQGIKVDKVA